MKVKVINAQTQIEVREINLFDFTALTGECLMGRSPNSGLVLDSPDVSRLHARFAFEDGHYYFYDLGSANGSLVNGQIAHANQGYLLQPGDIVRVGEFILILQDINELLEDLSATVVGDPNATVVRGWQPSLVEPLAAPTPEIESPQPEPVAHDRPFEVEPISIAAESPIEEAESTSAIHSSDIETPLGVTDLEPSRSSAEIEAHETPTAAEAVNVQLEPVISEPIDQFVSSRSVEAEVEDVDESVAESVEIEEAIAPSFNDDVFAETTTIQQDEVIEDIEPTEENVIESAVIEEAIASSFNDDFLAETTTIQTNEAIEDIEATEENVIESTEIEEAIAPSFNDDVFAETTTIQTNEAIEDIEATEENVIESVEIEEAIAPSFNDNFLAEITTTQTNEAIEDIEPTEENVIESVEIEEAIAPSFNDDVLAETTTIQTNEAIEDIEASSAPNLVASGSADEPVEPLLDDQAPLFDVPPDEATVIQSDSMVEATEPVSQPRRLTEIAMPDLWSEPDELDELTITPLADAANTEPAIADDLTVIQPATDDETIASVSESPEMATPLERTEEVSLISEPVPGAIDFNDLAEPITPIEEPTVVPAEGRGETSDPVSTVEAVLHTEPVAMEPEDDFGDSVNTDAVVVDPVEAELTAAPTVVDVDTAIAEPVVVALDEPAEDVTQVESPEAAFEAVETSFIINTEPAVSDPASTDTLEKDEASDLADSLAIIENSQTTSADASETELDLESSDINDLDHLETIPPPSDVVEAIEAIDVMIAADAESDQRDALVDPVAEILSDRSEVKIDEPVVLTPDDGLDTAIASDPAAVEADITTDATPSIPAPVQEIPAILKQKYIALMAHDSQRAELIQLVARHQEFFSQCLTIATPAINDLLKQQIGIEVSQQTPVMPPGGYQAVNSLVMSNQVLAVIFLRDFLIPHSTQANDEALSRSCNVNKILFANNIPTAEAIVHYIRNVIASLEGRE
ncbi:FHA domain-containing protein [Oculatella sp. LEGE 06141]|uniref:FHA domain-containing protein n=1 Tax=Oculatella sp. LEGE 06141 TaxID=1828648 RepID=UPI0018829FDA|nr:FHA domain-containing protein [Oculatella sp. LEGE 06141]MBE9181983.1 FHA domain-containing protein [Oculatella sp. LEGE 06141]